MPLRYLQQYRLLLLRFNTESEENEGESRKEEEELKRKERGFFERKANSTRLVSNLGIQGAKNLKSSTEPITIKMS
jgi:hypothetical protein